MSDKNTETEKAIKVKKESQAIGEFLDWLEEKDVWLAKYDKKDNLETFYYQKEKLLAEFFGIDLKKIEEEKKEILQELKDKMDKEPPRIVNILHRDQE